MGWGCVTAYYLKRYFWAASGESPVMARVAPTACGGLTGEVEKLFRSAARLCFSLHSLLISSLKLAWLAAWVTWTLSISTLVLSPLVNTSTPPFFTHTRVRFLLGGRHGDFKFLPPSSYAPCYEALLPKEKMKVEPVKEYKRDVDGVRDLLGTAHVLSQASFIPTPVETSQVNLDVCVVLMLLVHLNEIPSNQKQPVKKKKRLQVIKNGEALWQ